ncbi:hypothetical protein [Acetivibrio straminisolvens]|jgi:hypothetical protein|uniref:hypothetical protein n=1 Tax=Acetivibrio straminisolvens TaxID=253314 RepID=UPI0022405D74|nr:hypothetical protein [Acetivibrio straminisolvens]
MNVEFKYVEDIILDKIGPVCPEFDVCNGNPYVFTLLRPQFFATFEYDETNGPVIYDEAFEQLCEDLIKKAKYENVDVLITPEYCIPLDIITKIISDTSESLKPNLGKIWCLCCQGTKYDSFLQYLDKFEELGAKVIRYAVETATLKNFINALIYVFRLTDGRICILPQLKTQIMADRDLLCEGMGMSVGRVVYKFGKERPNQLCTIICADALNFRNISLSNINSGNENIILLHPQLNEKPRNSTFCRLKYNLYDSTECDSMIYITVNWAYGTKLIHRNNPQPDTTLSIINPWSCIYVKDINNQWLEQQRCLRNHNFSKGLGFGYFNRCKLKIWYCLKNEIIHLLTIKKPKGIGPSVAQPKQDVTVNKVYEAKDRRYLIEKDYIRKDNNLRELLDIREDEIDYNFPLRADKENRDIFFGVCLGYLEKDLEKGQLAIVDNEVCNIVSIHIDDECEEQRLKLINHFNILVNLLKAGKLPPYMKELVRSHMFSLEDCIFNLVSKDNNVRAKAIVSYVPYEPDAKKVSSKMKEEEKNKNAELNKDIIYELISEERENEIRKFITNTYVCVFTQKRGTTQIISYPEYKPEITSSDRVPDGTSIMR